MPNTIPLYVALILRLRSDAAGALSALLLVRHTEEPPVDSAEIEGFVYPDRGTDPLRYCARVKGRPGSWLCGYASDPCKNEIEALCDLIERTHAALADEGGSGLPFHLLDQFEADADALALYRRLAAEQINAADAREELDDAAELGSLVLAL